MMLMIFISNYFFSEFLESNLGAWHQIRGTFMIAVMKIISLGFDLESGKLKEKPTVPAILGYILCPANCVLGPWISYNDYLGIYNTGSKFRWVSVNGFFVVVFLHRFNSSFSCLLCRG